LPSPPFHAPVKASNNIPPTPSPSRLQLVSKAPTEVVRKPHHDYDIENIPSRATRVPLAAQDSGPG
ncbi:hypothetical protein C8F01DRAFT_1236119, partial [Mycena amicta]